MAILHRLISISVQSSWNSRYFSLICRTNRIVQIVPNNHSRLVPVPLFKSNILSIPILQPSKISQIHRELYSRAKEIKLEFGKLKTYKLVLLLFLVERRNTNFNWKSRISLEKQKRNRYRLTTQIRGAELDINTVDEF